MFLKATTLFLTVAVFIIQPNDVMLQYSPDPFCNSLIAGAISSANNTLNTALAQAANITTQFYTALKGFETNVQNNVNAILNQINTTIATEVQKQGGLVSKIYNCTVKQQANINTYANNTFNSLLGCATSGINQGINDIVSIFGAINGTLTLVINYGPSINTVCGANPLTYLFCVLGQTATMNAQLGSYVVTIATKAIDLSVLVANIPNFPTIFTACLSSNTATALLNALPIIGNIVMCTLTP